MERHKAFITKYALTQSIYELDVEQCIDISPNTVKGPGVFDTYHGEGLNWHRTREGALACAEAMRVKKIASLKKSIKKMEALKFE